jgi:hypothetical protein
MYTFTHTFQKHEGISFGTRPRTKLVEKGSRMRHKKYSLRDLPRARLTKELPQD